MVKEGEGWHKKSGVGGHQSLLLLSLIEQSDRSED